MRAFWLTLVLVACAPTVAEDLPPVGEDLIASERAACEADGGRWGAGGLTGTMVCYRETKDAGQTCSQSSDCEGLCLARSRSCSPVTPLFGCYEVLGSGGLRSTLCID